MAQCLSFYTYCSTLGVGCYLYTDTKRTTPVSAGWVSDGTTSWVVNSSGMITGTLTCPIPVTQYATQAGPPSGGYVYSSTHLGGNFSLAFTSNTTRSYSDLAVSHNQSYITLTVANSGTIFRSSNAGSTFSSIGISGLLDPRSVAMSSSGQYQLIVDWGNGNNYGWVYRSTNYGVDWTQLGNSPGYKAWYGAAISTSGQYQTVVGDINTGRIVVSNNYGVSWSNKNAGSWRTIAMSADGQYQLAGGFLEYLTLSTNYGSTWSSIVWPWTAQWGYGNTYNWSSVAMSSSGQYMLAVADPGVIWLSQNYGATWTNQTGNGDSWSACSMYPSGEIMFAATRGSGADIWRSLNYGGNWSIVEQNSAQSYTSLTSVPPSPACPPYGTYVDQYCSGVDLYYIYADGGCSTYDAIYESNSPTCGGGGGFESYYCSCYGYDCDPYPNPCYYYSCSSCAPF
jgi:hypothetical protein